MSERSLGNFGAYLQRRELFDLVAAEMNRLSEEVTRRRAALADQMIERLRTQPSPATTETMHKKEANYGR